MQEERTESNLAESSKIMEPRRRVNNAVRDWQRTVFIQRTERLFYVGICKTAGGLLVSVGIVMSVSVPWHQLDSALFVIALGYCLYNVGEPHEPTRAQAAAARGLACSEDVRTIGPLLECLALQSNEIHERCWRALIGLLKKLTQADAAVITEHQKSQLYKYLAPAMSNGRAEGICVILNALPVLDDGSSVPYLEALATMNAGTENEELVKSSAVSCLALLTDPRSAQQFNSDCKHLEASPRGSNSKSSNVQDARSLIDSLAIKLAHERKKRALRIGIRFTFLPFAVIGCIVLIIAHTTYGNWPGGLFICAWYWLVIGMFFLALTKQPRISKHEQDAVWSLAAFNDPRATGVLLDVLTDRHLGRWTSNHVYAALVRIMPRLNSSSVSEFTDKRRSTLDFLLRMEIISQGEYPRSVVMSILDGYSRAGVTGGIPAVEKLASQETENDEEKQVIEAACRCLAALREREQAERNVNTLLRLADAPAPPIDTLMRPATIGQDNQTKGLLRPSALEVPSEEK